MSELREVLEGWLVIAFYAAVLGLVVLAVRGFLALVL
jgi:hypothetical protein